MVLESVPGARCDVESYQYSYSFSPELDQQWTLDRALRPAARDPGLRRARGGSVRASKDIRFERTVVSADFDEQDETWLVRTREGDLFRGRYCIMATGNLSDVKLPEIPGIEEFAGDCYHTGAWPRRPVDFAGRTVGIIGTGSSGIQCIPEIAREARQLTVFQRTPNYSVPACNRVLDEADIERIKADYPRVRGLIHRTRTGTILPRSRGPIANFTTEEIEQELAVALERRKRRRLEFPRRIRRHPDLTRRQRPGGRVRARRVSARSSRIRRWPMT